jgi:hypothetical protein
MTAILPAAHLPLASVVARHAIAKRGADNPVHWGALRPLFGPLAIPFAVLAKPR